MSLDPFSDFDREITQFLEAADIPPNLARSLEIPRQREFGERAFAAHPLAREQRRAPKQIAEDIASRFRVDDYRYIESVEPAGNGYVNFRLRYETFIPHLIGSIREAGDRFGFRPGSPAHRVVVEHTSVNPNKEWHVGHLRNAVLGDVLSRLLRHVGNEVQVQNYIDDTGLQAAQAVFALQVFPEPAVPGEKYDQYVGRAYVKVSAELTAEPELREGLAAIERGELEEDPAAVASIRARLENIPRLQRGILGAMHALEAGHGREITEKILDGQLETAYRLGTYYDLLNWESHLVRSHTFDEAMRLLQKSDKVYLASSGHYSGALVIETGPDPAPGEERKCEVLIRSNGLPTYVGKDIAYHLWKFGLLPDRLRYTRFREQPNGQPLWSTALEGEDSRWPKPERLVNIIAVDQTQPQEAVREGLRAAGFADAAEHLVHLGYGLVKTPEGRISGRRGARSADSVIDEAITVAHDRVKEKRSQDLSEEQMRSIADAVGIGAVRYFMVQYNPLREIVFDVRDVVSFDGNTGLYVQYALVRMFAILRRAQSDLGIGDSDMDSADLTLLQHVQEKRLAFHLAQLPDLLSTAARTMAVNLVAEYAFDLGTIFSQFYRDCGVLNAEADLRAARLLLVRTVRDVLTSVCGILGVPVIERL